MHSVRKLTLILIVLIVILGGPAGGQSVAPLDITPFETEARAALLMEPETGYIFYAKNIDEHMPPASITKMMTLLLAFEAVEEERAEWDDVVVTSENAWRMEGSQMFLNINQQLTYKEVVTGIAVISANDGCVALAEHLYGSESLFVSRMNERAVELGMTNTNFVNSHGWPAENHYMSAKDIAVLAQEIVLNHPELVALESQREFTFNNIRQYNRNPLLGSYPGADGLKTGWTTEAGHSLAGTARQGNMRLISVILNTPSESSRLNASRELLNFGFRNFTLEDIVIPGEIIEHVNLPQGKKRELAVTVERDLKAVLPIGQQNTILVKTHLNPDTTAPIEQGDQIGTVHVFVNEVLVSSGPLIAAEDMARANFMVRVLRVIGDFFRSLFQGFRN